MSVNKKEVLERLHAHPLFKKISKDITPAEREHMEKVVSAFVDSMAGSLSSISSKPGFREGLSAFASGKVPVSGSAG